MEDDGDDKDDSKRRTRNMSEKKRRDQFNALVNELSIMVSASNRKMDKSTVLKSTIAFLKNHNEVTVRSRAHDIQGDWKPAFLSNEEFTYLVLEALEGFIMVFTATGHINYVSDSITSLLGHRVEDVVNKSIFDLVFEDDRPYLFELLQGPGADVDSTQRDNEIRFQCHLRRGMLDCRDETTYELIEFNGHFRTTTEQVDGEETSYQSTHDSRVLFVCTGRLVTPLLLRDVSLADSSRSEFTSRHSLEWKFLFLDHRAPPIIGYLPFEVLGTSGYDYYHFDDLEKVVSCHEALMQKGELTSCYYRFLTKGQQWIWLQTRYYITYHQWNSKPEFVVCTHRVVNYADVAKDNNQENAETEMVNEEVGQASTVMKEAPVEESMQSMSPSYMSEASEAFGPSYHAVSRAASVKSGSALSRAGTSSMVGTAAPSSVLWPLTNVRHEAGSDTASVRYAPGSNTASLSGDSCSSHRNSSRQKQKKRTHGSHAVDHGSLMTFQQMKSEPHLVPQQAMGAQYLEPMAYVNTVGAASAMGGIGTVAPLGPIGDMRAMGAMGAIDAPGALPLSVPSLPVIVTPEQAQIQEQLQQKHEKLQQMILQQQEELRQVKEQLLLARLGILQPLPGMSSSYLPGDVQSEPHLPVAIEYQDQSGRVVVASFPPQPPPGHSEPPPPSQAHHHF